MLGEEIPELQHSEKFPEEIDPAKVRQTTVITGEAQISRRVPHSGIT
jgi:hypothetical protein